MTSKNIEVGCEYVVVHRVGNNRSHDCLVNLDSNNRTTYVF